jgi:hypothetical protein
MNLADWQLEKVLEVMQVPFPELTDLRFFSSGETPPVIPDSFLGGSAPQLRDVFLDGVFFPGLPKLLLTATHLVSLWLANFLDFGHFSPKAIADLLSALSSLKALFLELVFPAPRPGWQPRSLHPPNRSILPSLEDFRFNGVTDYLEEFVTFVDAPQLNKLQITFFDEIDFDTKRLVQFINRTPKLGKRDEAHVKFNYSSVYVMFGTGCHISLSPREPDRLLSSVAKVCNTSLPSMVEDLYIERQFSSLPWKNDAIGNSQWLQLLLPFTAVKNLYLREEFAPGIAAALEELVGTRITEVLPSLQNIFVEELLPSGPSSFQENVGPFVAARQLSDHPIAIFEWHVVKSPVASPDSVSDSDSVSGDKDSDVESNSDSDGDSVSDDNDSGMESI